MCFGKKRKKRSEGRDIPEVCEFCENAVLINDEENVLCGKKGIVSRGSCCRKYVYDPIKRVPKTMPEIPHLSDDDIL